MLVSYSRSGLRDREFIYSCCKTSSCPGRKCPMSENNFFDDLAEAIAGATSRRSLLRIVAGIAAASFPNFRMLKGFAQSAVWDTELSDLAARDVPVHTFISKLRSEYNVPVVFIEGADEGKVTVAAASTTAR